MLRNKLSCCSFGFFIGNYTSYGCSRGPCLGCIKNDERSYANGLFRNGDQIPVIIITIIIFKNTNMKAEPLPSFLSYANGRMLMPATCCYPWLLPAIATGKQLLAITPPPPLTSIVGQRCLLLAIKQSSPLP